MARSSIPLPREHGAWAMVVGPALIGLAAPGARVGTDAVVDGSVAHGSIPVLGSGILLVLALLAVFCLQHAIVRSLTTRRKDRSLRLWTVVYGGLAVASGGALVFLGGHTELLWLGLVSAAYFALHVFQVRRRGRREHRALAFELLTVAVLCTGALAGAIVAGAGWDLPAPGGFEPRGAVPLDSSDALGASGESGAATGSPAHSSPGWSAFWAYALSFTFFTGSVFHVRAIVRRLQMKSAPPAQIPRAALARESIGWHGVIGLLLVVAWLLAAEGTTSMNVPPDGSGESAEEPHSDTLVPPHGPGDRVRGNSADTNVPLHRPGESLYRDSAHTNVPLGGPSESARGAIATNTSDGTSGGGDGPPSVGVLRAALLTIAFVPAIVRAFRTAVGLRAPKWSLRRVGLVELGCTVSFVGASMVLLARGLLG